MPGQNSILLEKNGNITISDIEDGKITLHTKDGMEILNELRQLNCAQIDSLLQVAPKFKEQLSEQFSNDLENVAREKNVVKGSISNVGTVRIGDEIQYHYHSEIKLPKELTLSIAKTHPDDIIGREEDLTEVHNLLSNSKRVVMVNGLGGVGKTTLAQVYISKYYDEYEHIAWITQSSDNIENDFINAGGLIKNLQVETVNLKQEEIFKEIIRKLKAIAGKPNLLIIDNAEQSVQKYQHLLPGQPVWHVLLTSREEIAGFYIKLLGFLPEEQAIALFKKYYNHTKLSEHDIKDLIQSVDYHTLTIEILAKTAEVQRYDVATLMDAVKKDARANVAVPHNRQAAKIEKVGSYLSSVFNLIRLSEAEIWLLKQFICLPSTFHPYELLYELIRDGERPYNDTFSETLDDLAKRGWLLYSKETDSYKMHRIIAGVVRKEHTVSIIDIKNLIHKISTKLRKDVMEDNPVDKFVWIPFGKALLAEFGKDTANETAVLQNNLAMVLIDLGDYAGAKGLFDKAVLSFEKNVGIAHPFTAISYSGLATVLTELGDYEEAKGLLEKAVLIDEKNFGTEHPSTAKSYSNLAVVLKNLGDYEGAKGLLEKAVLSYEKNFGTEHPSTTISYSNLALVLQDLGDYAGAKVLLQKAILSDEKNFGTKHPFTAKSYSNLAVVLQALGNYEGAKGLLQKAVLSYEKNFGTEHPSTVTIYSNLALVLQDLGDYEGAKQILEKVLLFREKNLGTEHPSTAKSNCNLAMVLNDLGDYQEAKILLQKAVSFYEKNFGTEHPSTVTIYSNLAVVLQYLDDYKGAKELLQKAVWSDERNFGLMHPSTALHYSNLAGVLYAQGDYEEALEFSAKALIIFKSALPEGHTHIDTVNNQWQTIKGKMEQHY